MTLEKLLKDVKILAVVCNQFGDTGKGKFSDYFSIHFADVTARGTGGNNAGHTVVINGHERIFHLIPAGIVNDSNGQINVLGNGMVIDLSVLCSELNELDREGLSYNNLMISRDAHVIMPYHIKRDKSTEQSQKSGGIGTTGRGIGPCYADKIARRGITIGDLFDKEFLKKKTIKAARFYSEQVIDPDEIILGLMNYAERIRPYVRDTVNEMHNFVRSSKRILLEGAQGLLLSIEHGTYPYVTSSDCSLNGTANGVGLPAKSVDLCLGIVKFPFMTRVGGGPFPTELGGRRSEEYCGEEGHTKLDELKKYQIPFEEKNGKIIYNPNDVKILQMIHSEDPFIQGIGIRLAANEYGATTGRPRRIGFTDAVSAKYAVGINGPLMILTKVDSLAGAENFKICYGYRKGSKFSREFSRDEKTLREVEPQYKNYSGYADIGLLRQFDRLPSSLLGSISDFEGFTGGKVVAVSVGSDREATIIR